MGVDVVGAGPGRLITKVNTSGQRAVGSASITGAGADPTVWVQVTASLSAETLLTQVALHCSNATATLGVELYVDIAIGSSGSEASVCRAYMVGSNGASSFMGGCVLPVPVRIGSGQRVTVRVGNSGLTGIGSSIAVWLAGVAYLNVEDS